MPSSKVQRRTIDPLRRDLIAGAVIGFLLIVATVIIAFAGIIQIAEARDAQQALDRAKFYAQATMRSATELILAEGASAQARSLMATMKAGDSALLELSQRLPGEMATNLFVQKIDPEWETIRATLKSFAAKSGINTGGSDVMTAYGNLQKAMAVFEADFAVIEKAIVESVARRTTRAYWMIGSMMAIVLLLFIAINVITLRRLRRGLGGDLSYAIATTQRIASGDLSQAVTRRTNDNSSLLHALQTMSESLTGMVNNIRSGTDSIRTAASEVAAGNANLSARTEEQAATLEQTASSMEQLTTAVRENTAGANSASALAQEATRIAGQGGSAVSAVVTTMNDIQESSRRIGNIIGVIDTIAFQTNILALNAAVEAARAGEQGRGFAVVAAEVRALAQRSADAAKEIKSLIRASVLKVDDGTLQVQTAGNKMKEIVTAVENVSTLIARISVASRAQADGIEQVNHAVSQMDRGVQQNAALVEQAAAAAESMQDNTQQLFEAVGVFKLNEADLQQSPSAHSADTRIVVQPVLAPIEAQLPAAHQGRRNLASPIQPAEEKWKAY